MVSDALVQNIFINARPEQVWQALTTPEGLKAWYAFGGAEIDLHPGGAIVFRWDEHGVYRGNVEVVEPNQRFAFKFAPFEAGALPKAGNATIVTITLTPENNGTNLQLKESGYQTLDLPDQEKIANYITSDNAWADALRLLKSLAEKE